ncbi:MAG: hypothetical protein EPN74_01020 [Rhodanobacter sp.]|nr:MAG: hypothetical protein EPN74_01020 [Rhodanobacter sp.]
MTKRCTSLIVEVDPQTLSGEVACLSVHLNAFFDDEARPDAAYAFYQKVVICALNPNDQDARDWLIDHHPTGWLSNERQRTLYVDAWIELASAEQALAVRDEGAARRYVAAVRTSIDAAKIDYEATTIPEQDRYKRAKGGLTTHANLLQVQTKAAAFVRDLAPLEGWKSYEKCAEAVALHLNEIVGRLNKDDKTRVQIGSYTDGWIKRQLAKEGPMREAYLATSRKTYSLRPSQ